MKDELLSSIGVLGSMIIPLVEGSSCKAFRGANYVVDMEVCYRGRYVTNSAERPNHETRMKIRN